MNINEYKSILNKNEIYLFDPEYRISFHRLNQLLINDEQSGGGINKINNLKNIKSTILDRLVGALIINNTVRAKVFIEHFL